VLVRNKVGVSEWDNMSTLASAIRIQLNVLI
jgi:hypothetical protein